MGCMGICHDAPGHRFNRMVEQGLKRGGARADVRGGDRRRQLLPSEVGKRFLIFNADDSVVISASSADGTMLLFQI